jgi:hypothetical protein
MKELSIEEKAKAYDEAIEKLRDFYRDYDTVSHLIDVKEELENIFPELKLKDSEKIRKEIVSAINIYCSEYHRGTKVRNDMLAWVEKQGEQKPADKIQLGKKYKCIASPRYSAFVKGEIYKPEDKFLCSLMNFCSDCFEPIEDGEQKPADKVKPKFKVGDWVIDKQDIVHQIANVIENVTYHTYGYDIVGGGYFNDNTEGVRLWTIQDAKDGDVLYMDNGLSTCTFIYKSIDNVIIQKYASYNKFGFEGTTYLVLNDGYVCPATKEQRDLLFQKMKDAGYEWDAEKKEVKKIEQKQDVSIQINPSDYINDMGGNGCYLKNTAQASAWSEEDREYMKSLLDIINGTSSLTSSEIECHKDWLKSLKDRHTWKPSKEQMNALDDVISSRDIKYDVLSELWKDLNKL